MTDHTSKRGAAWWFACTDTIAPLEFCVDRQYRYISFNQDYADLMLAVFGTKIELGRCLLDDITHPEDREQARRNLDRTLLGEPLIGQSYSSTDRRMFTGFHTAHIPLRNETGDIVGVSILAWDIRETEAARRQQLADLRFFESMDRINRTIQGTDDTDRMLMDVLDAMLGIFDCDRAWLVYPCDPTTPTFRVPMERCRPEFAGTSAVGLDVPVVPDISDLFAALRATDRPVTFGPGADRPLPAEMARSFSIQSQIVMAIYPKNDAPYAFGMHQCSYPREWTREDARLFEQIGRRLADGLSSALADQEMRESIARHEETQRIAHIGYWQRDFVGNLFILSAEARRIFGIPESDSAFALDRWDERWLAMIHAEDRDRVAKAFEAALLGESKYNVEYRLVVSSGEFRHVHSEGEVSRDASGRPIRMLGMVQDTTERIKNEQIIRESEERLRTLFDTSTQGIVAADVETRRFTQVNPAICAMLGYTADELLTMGVDDIHPKGEIGRIHEIFEAQARKDYSYSPMMPCVRKDGTVFYADVSTAPIVIDGRAHNVGFFQDVTERKQFEDALRRLNRELRAISDCNQVLLRAENEQMLLDSICSIICVEAGYRMTWVGYAENDAARTIRPVAWAGHDAGYIANARLTWSDETDHGRGPAGTAIRSGEPFVVQDFETDPSMGPWRESALMRGFRAGIALPLKDETRSVFGVLLIYSTEANSMTAEEIRLLGELADDLAFGIASLRVRAERTRLERIGQARLRLLEISNTCSPGELLSATLDEIEALTGSRVGFCHLLEPDQTSASLRTMSARTRELVSAGALAAHHDLSNGPAWAECLREKTPIVRNIDTSGPPGDAPSADDPSEINMINAIVLPIFRGGFVRAIVGIGGKAAAYQHGDIEAVSSLADLALDIVERKRAEEVLSKRDADLRESQRLALIGSWDWDAVHDTIWWSDVYYAIYGLDPRQPTPNYTDHLKAYTPESAKRLDAAVNRAMESGEPYELDLELANPTANTHWIIARGEVKRDADGKVIGLRGTAQNITDRKKAELYRQLTLSVLTIINDTGSFRETARRIVAAIRAETGADVVGIRLRDGDDYPYFVQQGFSDEFLKHENSLIAFGPDGAACVGRDGRTQLECTCGLVISGKTDPANPLFTKGGSFWVNDSLPLLDLLADEDPRLHPRNRCIREGYRSVALVPVREAGRIVGLLHINHHRAGQFTLGAIQALEGIAAHIGSALMRKQAEETLREREETFRALAESSVDTIMRFDSACRHLYVNPVVQTHTGIAAEHFLGKTHAELGFPPELCQLWETSIQNVFRTGKVERAEFRLPNGIWMDWLLMPEFGRNGSVQAVVTSARDITERKRAEDEKERLRNELQQAMKMEAVGRLAGGVAHDFNNLLTAITGNIELALMDLKPDDPLVETLTAVNAAATSASAVTRQLLSFSRKQLIKPKLLNLNDIISTLHKMLTRLIGEDIDLKTIPGENLRTVKVDPGQVEQIIVNLVVNARDAMPDGGELLIETANVDLGEDYCRKHSIAKPGPYVMLAISDTGSGMSDETKKHLFEPFFTTKGQGKGTGLGLATIYGAVKQADGFVDVYSELGEGTTFKIFLPQVAEQAEKLETGRWAMAMPSGDETILLVEDEKSVRELAVKVLRKLGYTVLDADSGGNALVLAEQFDREIHLLLTDVVMPGMSGKQLAERMSKVRPAMKVLYTSGYTENAIAHHGVVDEGLNFIGKPYVPRGLATAVRKALDRK